MIRKILFIISSILLILLIFGYSLWRMNIPQIRIKKIIEQELSKSLNNSKVRIGSLGGNLLNSIDLYDLRISDFIKCKKVSIHYSLLKTVGQGGDVLKNIKVIVLESPNVLIAQNRKMGFNFEKISPKEQGNNGQIFFNGEIKFNDGKVSYIDEVNYYDDTSFNRGREICHIKNLDGSLVVTNNFKLKLFLKGLLTTKYQKTAVSIEGISNADTYKVDVNIKKLDLRVFSDYFLPEEIKIKKGYADTTISLAPLNVLPGYGELPLDIKIKANVQQGHLKIKNLSDLEVENLEGFCSLDNKGIYFSKIRGNSLGANWDLSGSIHNFNNFYSDIAIKSQKFQGKKISNIIPVFSNVAIDGLIAPKIHITGPIFDKPQINIDISSEQLRVYDRDLYSLSGQVNYKDDQLKILVKEFQSLGGIFRGTGNLNFSNDKPNMFMEFFFKDIDISNIQGQISGNILGKILIKGNVDDFNVWTKVYSKNTSFYDQKISYLELNARVTPHLLGFYDSAINLNNSAIYFDAEINDKDVFWINLNSDYFNIVPFVFFNESVKEDQIVDGSGRVNCALHGKWSNDFWQRPWDYLRGKVDLELQKAFLFNQDLDYARCQLEIKDNSLVFSPLLLTTDQSKLLVTGNISFADSINLEINGSKVNISSLGFLRQIFPDFVDSFLGIGDFSLTVSSDLKGGVLIENTSVLGSLSLSDAIIFGQAFDNIQARVNWDGNKVKIEEFDASVGNSIFSLYGNVGLDKQIDITLAPNSKFNIPDFNLLFNNIENVNGVAYLSGHIKGTLDSPEISSNVLFENLQANKLQIDYVEGKVLFKDNKLGFEDVVVKEKEDSYKVNAFFDISESVGEDFNLNIQIPEGKLVAFTNLIENFLQELHRYQHRNQEVKNKEKIDKRTLKRKTVIKFGSIVDPLYTKIYRSQKGQNTALDFIEEIEKEIKTFYHPAKLKFVSQVSGNISGNINISRIRGRLYASSFIEIASGSLSGLSFDLMSIKINTVKKGISISCIIDKGLLAGGDFDSLKSNFVYTHDGWLQVNKFDVSAQENSQKDILRGEIPLSAIWDDNLLEKEMDIKVRAKKNNINFFTFFDSNIDKITNEGEIELSIKGPLRNPIISAEVLDLKNATVFFNPRTTIIETPLKIEYADISLNKNVLDIKSLDVHWKGENTFNQLNKFAIKGKVAFKEITFVNPDKLVLDIDLSIGDTSLFVNFPKICNGEVKLKDLYFKGDLVVPISEEEKAKFVENVTLEQEKGPLLFGKVIFSNGRIFMPENSPSTVKPGVHLDLIADIGEDVFFSRGQLLNESGDFINVLGKNIIGNFDFELQKTYEPLQIKGSINTPVIKGQLGIEEGSMFSFFKKFDLLSKEEKKKYFKDIEKVQDNIVIFDMTQRLEEKVKRKIKPIFKIVAHTEDNSTTQNTKIFLIVIDGAITNFQDVEDLQSIYFLKYQKASEETTLPVLEKEYRLVGEDNEKINQEQLNELYESLMPSFLKRLIQGDLESNTSQELFADYAENQADVIFHSILRPHEKNIAKNIGLYDLKIKRNFGRDFNRLVGLDKKEEEILSTESDSSSESESTTIQEQEYLFGLDIVEELIANRIFLTLNTEVTQEKQRGLKWVIGSYKLTVLLFKDFIMDDISINFENNVTDESSVKQSLSIEASHWF